VAIEKPTAAADAFVVAVRIPDGRAAAGRLRSLGRPPRDPRKAWRAVLAERPEVEWAAPVFRDASGSELLPTGAVVVRFRKKLSDRGLEAFAIAFTLALERRNEFVPEQASFRPSRPREVYLPDLLDDVSRHADVAAAWPATRSRYRKV
jgi:hypothetical protein